MRWWIGIETYKTSILFILVMEAMDECVRGDDHEQWARLVVDEMQLDDIGQGLESRIDALRIELAKASGHAPESMPLGQLAATLDAPCALMLNDRRQRIVALIERLFEVSSATAQLVRFALDFNGELLAALTGQPTEADVYRADGSFADRVGAGMFEQEI